MLNNNQPQRRYTKHITSYGLKASYDCYDCFEVHISQASGYVDKETGRATCIKCYEKEKEESN